ncbi:MAG: succinylglutamate desuccinylase/aspartoacylase family protein [Syntrophaceae bacterium]|nr:succinylglutamate desuccinylase/aspartoacylase family protein [Syntrophaceae bacterium]
MLKTKISVGGYCLFFYLLFFLLLPYQAFSLDSSSGEFKRYLKLLEEKFSSYGWTDIKPQEISWEYHRTTKNKHPLFFAIFGNKSKHCTLFLGGVHGDELPSVYLIFKLAHYIKENPELFYDRYIVIAPLLNPDGFLSASPKRVNSNGVDINRNFPTRDWRAKAIRQWIAKGKKKRYYPGAKPASEQETLFQIALIKRFNPQKILSVHSPLNFFDYDGPSADLDSLEKWMKQICKEINHPLKKFGYYPGSLGNYAGHERNIFTLTLELPSSDPKQGKHYFEQFQPSISKFIDLPIVGFPPRIRIIGK